MLDFLKNIPETTRAYFYRIALAVVAIAVAYGFIDEGTSPLWISLIGAVFAVGAPVLATVNTSRTLPPPPPQGVNEQFPGEFP